MNEYQSRYVAAVSLLQNAGAVTGDSADWVGGEGLLTAEGTFGAGNVSLQCQTPNGTWVPVHLPYAGGGGNVVIAANGTLQFFLPACKIRAVSTGTSGIFAYAIPVLQKVIRAD